MSGARVVEYFCSDAECNRGSDFVERARIRVYRQIEQHEGMLRRRRDNTRSRYSVGCSAIVSF